MISILEFSGVTFNPALNACHIEGCPSGAVTSIWNHPDVNGRVQTNLCVRHLVDLYQRIHVDLGENVIALASRRLLVSSLEDDIKYLRFSRDPMPCKHPRIYCRTCMGRGHVTYGSTSMGHGGIGGQAMTEGPCNSCNPAWETATHKLKVQCFLCDLDKARILIVDLKKQLRRKK